MTTTIPLLAVETGEWIRGAVARAAKYALDGAGIGIPFPIRTLDIPPGSPLGRPAASET